MSEMIEREIELSKANKKKAKRNVRDTTGISTFMEGKKEVKDMDRELENPKTVRTKP